MLDSFNPRAVDSRRLFHGRGHCFQNFDWLTIDWHPPIVVATLYQNPGEAAIAQLHQQLSELNTAVFVQYRYLKPVVGKWLGQTPEPPFYASRHGLKFELSLGGRQNLGYFVDMEPGRQWLEKNASGRGLNLFAYTCALSCVALANGASEVVNVDMSRAALTTGQRNHQLNQLPGARFLKMDVFKSWKKLAAS
ncbi:MAG: class I SAM-dependent methyltransferase, partial [Porticoccaceae bacterium]|nr:class I SAM-dependent methyltransferase [Porticoccaceae bacterium]